MKLSGIGMLMLAAVFAPVLFAADVNGLSVAVLPRDKTELNVVVRICH